MKILYRYRHNFITKFQFWTRLSTLSFHFCVLSLPSVFKVQPGQISTFLKIFFFSLHFYAFSQGAVSARFGNVENGALLSHSSVQRAGVS